MAEKPLERLNYHNGQRLEATDLKAEQDYHIRTRRWLNKSLYSAGIASGLEIHAEPNSAFVVVSSGMALDNEGREIILLQEERVEVKGYAPGAEDLKVQGPYITIEYAEETISEEHGSCTIRGTKGKAQSAAAWGGPARVRAKPILSLSPFLPHAKSNKIVLAQVEVDTKCNISQINFSVRHYVGASSAATVHQYALEGEREVAHVVTKDDLGSDKEVEVKARIYFHIRGRQPNGITLYLRAEEFSQLHYTELGKHIHALDVKLGLKTSPPQLTPDGNPDKYKHKHSIAELTTRTDDTSFNGSHTDHKLNVTFSNAHSTENSRRIVVADDIGLAAGASFTIGPFGAGAVVPVGAGDPVYADILPVLSERRTGHPNFTAGISEGTHAHKIATFETNLVSVVDDHYHTFDPDVSMSNSGVDDYYARSGITEKALTYINGLEIYIDDIPQTQNILNQILNERPAAERPLWKNKLGDGTSNHPIAIIGKEKGTGPIRLNFLQDTNFSEGEHVIELVAPRILEGGKVKPNGGKVIYNLYIE